MAVHGRLFIVLNSLGNYRSILNNRIPYVCLQQNAGIKTETKEKLKTLNIPEKPKKPLSAYFRYFNEHRSDIKKRYPELKLTDIAKKCAADWKGVDDKVKEQYREQYQKEAKEFEKINQDYTAGLSEEQSEFLKNFSKEKQNDKKKRQMRKRFKETEKPKRPTGAYMLFVMDKAKELDQPFKDLLKTCKDKWQLIPPSEKERYLQSYKESSKQYVLDVQKWEAKMIEEGHTDVVRPASLANKPSHLSKAKKTDHE